MDAESLHEGRANAENIQYRHDPLDYRQASIRVIEVGSTTSDGYIRCTLRHTDVESTYTCLSYVWGDTSERQLIMINGRPFFVHHNLWEFLRVAQVNYQFTPFWIDAICIDQEAILERNHQVRHMGEIFSRAVQVIAWLGSQQEIIEFLDLLSNRSPTTNLLRGERFVERRTTSTSTPILRRVVEGIQCFSMLEYWQRAWITQEIALAQDIFFMAGSRKIHITELPLSDLDWANSPAGRLAFATPYPRAERAMDQMLTQFNLRRRRYSLVYLLDIYSYKKCRIARDRIFSLLAICAEGSDLVPDYRISDEEVLVQTLQGCSRSLCFCTVGAVASVLDTKPSAYDEYHVEVGLHRTWAQDWVSKLRPYQYRMSAQHRCDVCRAPLPASWFADEKAGYTICLNGICDDFRGHFFIDLDDEATYTSVEVHVSLPRTHTRERVSNHFTIEVEWYNLSHEEKGTYGLRFRLSDLLRLVTERGRWWQKRHIGETQYRGCLSLMTGDESDSRERLSNQDVREFLKLGKKVVFSDFEKRRKQFQGDFEYDGELMRTWALSKARSPMSIEDYVAWRLPDDTTEAS